MKQTPLTTLIEEHNLTQVGLQSYGFIGDYPMHLQMLNNLVQITFPLQGDVKPLRGEVKTALKGVARAVAVSGDILVISLPYNKTLGDKYREMTRILPPLLKSKGILPAADCAVCGSAGCDSAAFHRGAYRPVHGACVHGLEQQTAESVAQNEASGNYFTGLVGALLGGFVGIIPSILSIWFAQRVFALLYALIPICIYYGYKLLRGRMNRIVLPITLVLSVVYAALIDFIFLGVNMVEAGIPLALMDRLLFEQGYLAEMIPDFLMSLLFIGLGILCAWSIISRTARSQLGDVAAVVESMAPLPGHTPAVATANAAPLPADDSEEPLAAAETDPAPAAEPAPTRTASAITGREWDNTKDPWEQ